MKPCIKCGRETNYVICAGCEKKTQNYDNIRMRLLGPLEFMLKDDISSSKSASKYVFSSDSKYTMPAGNEKNVLGNTYGRNLNKMSPPKISNTLSPYSRLESKLFSPNYNISKSLSSNPSYTAFNPYAFVSTTSKYSKSNASSEKYGGGGGSSGLKSIYSGKSTGYSSCSGSSKSCGSSGTYK